MADQASSENIEAVHMDFIIYIFVVGMGRYENFPV